MIENLLTRCYFNSLAEEWETNQTIEDSKINALLSRLKLDACDTILDIGCGAGIMFPFLQKFTCGRAKIFAMDFAECMVFEAVQKKYSSINVLCGCVRYLPFGDNTIDRIIAFQVFPHIQGKNLALKECLRVLKGKGELAIIHIHSSNEINSIHHEIGGLLKEHHLPSADQMCMMLKEAGFYIKTAIDRNGEYYVGGIKMNYLSSS